MIGLSDITLVTVTYGNRAELLLQSLQSAYCEGIRSIVVVDNGSAYDLGRFLEENLRGQDWTVRVVSLGNNTGSARGFTAGMLAAVEAGGDYILLLDDDGMLQEGSIDKLIKGYEAIISEGYSNNNILLSAIRFEHSSDLREGVLTRCLNRRSSFRRFHLCDIHYRLIRRIGFLKRHLFSDTYSKRIRVPYAVYSGLFFHRDVIDRYGFPKEDFFLYGDDLEFTYRITADGGSLWLITDAVIKDMNISWWCRLKAGNPFDALILGGGDSVVYYAFRNEVYFESHCLKRGGPLYKLHRTIYMALLFFNALRHRRLARFRILQRALMDGIEGKLGENPSFPIGS